MVSDEVRGLAQRSAQAAKESVGKVDKSVLRSDRGVQQSAAAAEQLKAQSVVLTGIVDELSALVGTGHSGAPPSQEPRFRPTASTVLRRPAPAVRRDAKPDSPVPPPANKRHAAGVPSAANAVDGERPEEFFG